MTHKLESLTGWSRYMMWNVGRDEFEVIKSQIEVALSFKHGVHFGHNMNHINGSVMLLFKGTLTELEETFILLL